METGSGPGFTYELLTGFNGEIPAMQSINILVTYSPSAPEYTAAVLGIEWPDGEHGSGQVQLDGTGIEAPRGPLTIEDIQGFFDAGVDAGTIEGTGPNDQAKESHLKVFEWNLIMVSFFPGN
jgi:hypothetical protein